MVEDCVKMVVKELRRKRVSTEKYCAVVNTAKESTFNKT
jgi:hypothetical protein